MNSLVRRLELVKSEFGGGSGPLKLALLRAIGSRPLARRAEVVRLHEALCFLRAYPDDPAVLREVDGMLRAFSKRRDVRAHREALADSGIAGTDIHFRFFAPTASWLARRWGKRLSVEWKGFRGAARLDRWLPLLTLYCETPALDEFAFDPKEWIARLKAPGETDAEFLISRFDALRVDSFVREKLYDELDPPLVLAAGPDVPSRTLDAYPRPRVYFQARPFDRKRPELRREIRKGPVRVRDASPAEAARLIDLARGAMITRSRDLDVFSFAAPGDVRVVDCGDGLEFACIGFRPERRLLLESVYGFLTLKNGIPIGYVLCSALFGSSEIAYNVFATYRGAEAAHVYGRVLGMVRTLFGSDAFTIYPYQLGHENMEALKSGAWWFYRKLGFAPRDRATLALARREEQRMKLAPSHRSSLATLRRLSSENLYYFSGRARTDVMGILSMPDVGLRISRYLGRRFGADRERGEAVCAEEARRLLGLRTLRGWGADERLAWKRWAPLVLILPGLDRWSRSEKRALIEVIRAKGGRRESDFVARFDRHRRLREAVRRLAAAS